ncbi:MAG: hypothetical protein FJ303_00100 [Planctomycetes bacterium]|nr:hypothetical protein [Planctomycetota bacterium]
MSPFRLVFASDLHFASEPNVPGLIEVATKVKSNPPATAAILSSQALGAYVRRLGLPSRAGRATSHDSVVARRFAQRIHINADDINLLLTGGARSLTPVSAQIIRYDKLKHRFR